MGCYAKVSAAFFINSNCRRKTASPTLSSRPERSAVEGPAVCSIPPTQEPSFLASRWVVTPRLVLRSLLTATADANPPLQPCHPDRSEAQWRDLQFARSPQRKSLHF